MSTAREPIPDDRQQPRLLRGAWWLTGGITVLSLVPSVGYFVPTLGRLAQWSADVAVWSPFLQLTGMVGLLFALGRPRSRRGWWVLGALNAWCLTTAVLRGLHLLEVTVAFLIGVGIRLGVLFLWGYTVVGLPVVVFVIARANPGQRFSRTSVRLWFAMMLTLIAVEPLGWWLQQSSDELAFPESLPPSPSGQLRIVALGSSTMVGHPYEPKLGIPQIVAWRVQAMYPERKVVLENLAVPGHSLRQALRSLQQLSYRPHLILLYSGHNEFMHDLDECLDPGSSPLGEADRALVYSPMFRMLQLHLNRLRIMRNFRGGMRFELVDRQVAPPVLAEIRLRRFERHLAQLARFGQRQHIPMLWYVPAATESGFEPNSSWVRPGTPPSANQELVRLWETINELLKQENWTSAAERCREGLQHQPQFAEFHFRLGESLLKLGQANGAQQHFAQAMDNDGHPLRLIDDYQRVVQEVADQFGIVTVNGEAVLRPYSPHGILDRSLFYDNVHPTIRGFFQLGRAGANEVFQKKLLAATFGEPRPIPDVTQADAVRQFEIEAADVAVAHRRIANGLRWLSQVRFDPQRRLREADQLDQMARLIENGEVRTGERGIESLDGD